MDASGFLHCNSNGLSTTKYYLRYRGHSRVLYQSENRGPVGRLIGRRNGEGAFAENIHTRTVLGAFWDSWPRGSCELLATFY
jgi:hypothetical protein